MLVAIAQRATVALFAVAVLSADLADAARFAGAAAVGVGLDRVTHLVGADRGGDAPTVGAQIRQAVTVLVALLVEQALRAVRTAAVDVGLVLVHGAVAAVRPVDAVVLRIAHQNFGAQSIAAPAVALLRLANGARWAVHAFAAQAALSAAVGVDLIAVSDAVEAVGGAGAVRAHPTSAVGIRVAPLVFRALEARGAAAVGVGLIAVHDIVLARRHHHVRGRSDNVVATTDGCDEQDNQIVGAHEFLRSMSVPADSGALSGRYQMTHISFYSARKEEE